MAGSPDATRARSWAQKAWRKRSGSRTEAPQSARGGLLPNPLLKLEFPHKLGRFLDSLARITPMRAREPERQDLAIWALVAVSANEDRRGNVSRAHVHPAALMPNQASLQSKWRAWSV